MSHHKRLCGGSAISVISTRTIFKISYRVRVYYVFDEQTFFSRSFLVISFHILFILFAAFSFQFCPQSCVVSRNLVNYSFVRPNISYVFSWKVYTGCSVRNINTSDSYTTGYRHNTSRFVTGSLFLKLVQLFANIFFKTCSHRIHIHTVLDLGVFKFSYERSILSISKLILKLVKLPASVSVTN